MSDIDSAGMHRRKKQQGLGGPPQSKYLPGYMQRQIGDHQQMATKVLNANISYRDQKQIMKSIFGQGKMMPGKVNTQSGFAYQKRKAANVQKTRFAESILSQS